MKAILKSGHSNINIPIKDGKIQLSADDLEALLYVEAFTRYDAEIIKCFLDRLSIEK